MVENRLANLTVKLLEQGWSIAAAMVARKRDTFVSSRSSSRRVFVGCVGMCNSDSSFVFCWLLSILGVSAKHRTAERGSLGFGMVVEHGCIAC
jgi:hypothetical protein